MKTILSIASIATFVLAHSAVASSADDFPEPIAKVLKQIETLVGDSYDWEFRPELPDAAMSFPGNKIIINPRIWASMSSYAIFFAILHEIGHHQLGHTSYAGQIAGLYQPWLRPSMELAADRYAAKKMLESGIKAYKVRAVALEVFGRNPGDSTHPSGVVRARNLADLLSNQ